MRLHTEIDIAAPPEVVWNVLTDLDSYADWNPFVTRAEGSVAVGARLLVHLAPPGGRPATFRPTVTVVEPDRTFEWLGRLGVPGIFDGRHRFDLHPLGSGTRLVQSERFAGVAVPLLARSLDRTTRLGFEAMNRSLKQRAEAAVHHPA